MLKWVRPRRNYTSLDGCYQARCRTSESWTGSCTHSGSTFVCDCEDHPMELARIIRRRQVCSSTWRAIYIEMATLATLGYLFDGSGWTNDLTQAGIATLGTADSFLKGAHVKRTRHAHQVTSSALSIMLQTIAWTQLNHYRLMIGA